MAGSSDVLGTTVLHRVEHGIATITLHRPEAANALLPEQRDVIIELLAAADPDPDVRAVAVRSEGRHFCSGADVGTIRSGQSGEPKVGDGMRRIMNGAQRLVAAVLDCPKPVVAVVQGTAAGLGAHLAFACDMVVASEDAAFIEPFLLRGIVVDAGGAYLLPRLIGLQRAKELAFLSEKLSAADAKDLGLVNRVVPAGELDRTAAEILDRLARAPTGALSLTKRLFNRSLDGDRAASFLEEAMAQELQSRSQDANEGISAFGERRSPVFKGY
ncbi:MAG TPA: enoyl-CoA hydratase-related protein [Acidimicrobiales bacterium]|nr:enoyl-CoA hydratase-related protein [Acidimicrobiales bacterium]